MKAKQQTVEPTGTSDMTQKRVKPLGFNKDKKEGPEVLPSSEVASDPTTIPPKTRNTTR